MSSFHRRRAAIAAALAGVHRRGVSKARQSFGKPSRRAYDPIANIRYRKIAHIRKRVAAAALAARKI